MCERDPECRKKCKSLGVENICNLFNGKIIQISSDYVFDGKMGPYTEDDNTNPISIYGKTKLLAEKVVLNHNDENIVLRTNVLYSYNSKTNACFVNWVVRSLKEKDKYLLLMINIIIQPGRNLSQELYFYVSKRKLVDFIIGAMEIF